jgi:hypothetical protein
MPRAGNISSRNRMYALGLFVIASGFAIVPFSFQDRTQGNNLTTQAKPLTGSQIMRGAYVNSGSKDAGADPDWQFDTKAGSFIYKGRAAGNFAPSEEMVAEARAALNKRKQEAQ